MKAIIVGAGPGGLTAALFLHRLGWTTEIYESTARIEPLGVGINLLPHGVRELMVLGLGEELAATGIPTRALEYRTRYGHLIYSDPRGRYAGFDFPSYSIHRGHLQNILLAAVEERTGRNAIHTSCHFDRYEEDERGVTAYFTDKASGANAAVAHGDVLIGADGIHSAVRRSLYTVEAPPQYEGIMMWRGAREQAPYLDGETMFIAGNHDLKVVCYPISAESARRGSSLVNWVAEVRFDAPRPLHPGDWTRRGGREFIERFTEFNLGFIDVRQLFLDTEDIYEFPMIDRDPLPRWSFGRVTLLGDAAHAMLPIGANGTSQAILDAAALAESVHTDDVVAGLQAYERRRIGPTATVVLSNREYLPERYLDLADQRLRGPDDRVEDLISPAEIDEITRSYRQLAGFDVDELNRKGLK